MSRRERLGSALIMGFGGWLVLTGRTTVGTVFVFATILGGRLMGSLSSLANMYVNVTGSDTFLFHASLADNLRYARPGAADAELIAAAKAAHLHEFAMSLPDGYDTIVGERGYRLSGGENQRWRSPGRS